MRGEGAPPRRSRHWKNSSAKISGHGCLTQLLLCDPVKQVAQQLDRLFTMHGDSAEGARQAEIQTELLCQKHLGRGYMCQEGVPFPAPTEMG